MPKKTIGKQPMFAAFSRLYFMTDKFGRILWVLAITVTRMANEFFLINAKSHYIRQPMWLRPISRAEAKKSHVALQRQSRGSDRGDGENLCLNF